MPKPRMIGVYDKKLEKVIWYNPDEEIREGTAPNVRDDTMEPFESYATGERLMFTSMSKYKAHLAEHGYEITGGDHLTGRTVENSPYKVNRDDIIETIREVRNQVKYGDFPFTEKEKEQCKREMRALKKY